MIIITESMNQIRMASIRTCFLHAERKIKLLIPEFCASRHRFKTFLGARYYLSSSYECKDAWEKRFQSPLLEKLNMSEFFMEIDKKFSNKLKVGAVDIDMFAINVKEKEELEELEALIHRFRRSKETIHMLESTPHAVIRSYLEHKEYDNLLKILNNRIDYGIFPDYYCYNLLLDTFIKEGKYKEASNVATLMMLQEDFDHPISRILALYACHMHRINPEEPTEPAQEQEPPPNEEDEEEEVYVRVPFLTNPYFDDHFDITNQQHLLGKTLYMVGKEFNDLVGRTYQLIGLGLYEKWEKAGKLLDTFIKASEKPVILEEGAKTFLELLNSSLESSLSSELKVSLQAKVDKLRAESLTSPEDLNTLVTQKLDEIKNFEAKDIAQQTQLYDKWEVDRQEALKKQIEDFFKEQRKKEIEAKKAELEERERLLFFFENWDKHEMELADAEKRIAELSPEKTEEDYIPPDVRKPLGQPTK